MIKLLLFIFLLSLGLGCSTIRKITAPPDENLISGSGSIMEDKTSGDFEKIDRDSLLDTYGLLNPQDVSSEQIAKPEEYKYRRNDLQERLISTSNQKCGAYLRTIVSSKAQAKTGWTSLALLFSGGAAVLPHTATAQALAAASAASTGILSTYDEAYFNNFAVDVIAAGIKKKRESILKNISNKKNKNLSEYSVNAAISDAIAYHEACNIIVGMNTASNALEAVNTKKITKDVRQ